MFIAKIKPHLYPELWQFNYLFSIGTRSWLVHCFVVTVVFTAMRGQGDFFVIWYIVMLCVSVTMLYICRVGEQLDIVTQSTRIKYLGLAHTVFVILVGIIWGIGAIKAAAISYGAALFFSLALGGTALGAVSSQSVVMRSCLSSIWTSVSLLAFAHWFIIPDTTGRYSAGLMFLFGVTLTILANRMNGFLVANHKLRKDLELQVVELEAARQIASEANASKSRFMAHASHDLRQPLHAIGLLNSNLQHEEMSDFAQDTVKKIDTSVASMSELFRALLDFSALELGQITIQKSRFDIVELLDEIVVRNLEQAKRKQCKLSVSAGACWVETDRSLLTNIIQNLVSNAIKYAPGKPILLRTDLVDKIITVSVLDQGSGIPSAEIKAVFKEYYQMERHDGQKADGLGLGLALVQKFSAILGLECTMKSDSTSGTKVQIAGLKAARPQAGETKKNRKMQHPLADLKVHVVDDDPEILAATVKLLKRWGCIATASAQIPEGTLGVDFLITDFHLGNGMNGKECIMRMRQAEVGYLPAIIITGQQNINLDILKIPEPVGLLEKPASAQHIRSLMLSQLTKVKALQAD